MLGLGDVRAIIGLRPGEILHCIHAFEDLGGCGTTEFCSQCGAVKAILAAQRGSRAVEECRIVREVGNGVEALDLRVCATPFVFNGEPFTIFTADNISHEKRRQVLERIFFHDVLNTVGALRGAAELIPSMDASGAQELTEMMHCLSQRLIEEISMQKDLAAAESGELETHPTPIDSLTFLRHVVQTYSSHEVAKERHIRVDPDAADVEFVSDLTLLSRVIGNMVKNALEASQPEQVVTLGCKVVGEEIRFWVHNPGFIPRPAQLQLFQRSFSTKGRGRGVGTYSMRLLSERYLRGAVSFASDPEAGTTFVARYPRQLAE
jgi:signal transduction histidine kinase